MATGSTGIFYALFAVAFEFCDVGQLCVDSPRSFVASDKLLVLMSDWLSISGEVTTTFLSLFGLV